MSNNNSTTDTNTKYCSRCKVHRPTDMFSEMDEIVRLNNMKSYIVDSGRYTEDSTEPLLYTCVVRIDNELDQLNNNDLAATIFQEVGEIDGYEYYSPPVIVNQLKKVHQVIAYCSQDEKQQKQAPREDMQRQIKRMRTFCCNGKATLKINRGNRWVHVLVEHPTKHDIPVRDDIYRVPEVIIEYIRDTVQNFTDNSRSTCPSTLYRDILHEFPADVTNRLC